MKKDKKENPINRLFKPIIIHIKEFPRNLQMFIIVGIIIGIPMIITLLAFLYSLYV